MKDEQLHIRIDYRLKEAFMTLCCQSDISASKRICNMIEQSLTEQSNSQAVARR